MIDKARVGPFQILNRLGTNRRHKVFRARQIEQHREVALKFIKTPPDVDFATAVSRIQREAEVLKKLDHPHLVRVYGAGVDGEQIFFAHELIHGESLTTKLSRCGKLAIDMAVDLAIQVADAIGYLHEHEIVHAKLTPDKILIDAEGNAHVNDVRLNRAKRRTWDSAHRRELDAAAYMAPEQFNDGATHKSDLFALGAILYEMVTGRIPLEPGNLASLYDQKTKSPPVSAAATVMDCPIWLDRLISALLHPDPADRPHSARAVYYALLEIRKIDKNLTPVVNQMTLGFNPLTIGADKTEARRLLGQLDVVDDRPPLYQRTWVQVVGLLSIVGMTAWLLWPISNETLFARGKQLLESDDIADVAKARDCFDRIVSRHWNDAWTFDAEAMSDAARGKMLTLNADLEKQVFEPNASQFIDAYREEKAGNTTEALRLYNRLLRNLERDDGFRHIVLECKKRIAAISANAAVTPANESDDLSSGEIPSTIR